MSRISMVKYTTYTPDATKSIVYTRIRRYRRLWSALQGATVADLMALDAWSYTFTPTTTFDPAPHRYIITTSTANMRPRGSAILYNTAVRVANVLFKQVRSMSAVYIYTSLPREIGLGAWRSTRLLIKGARIRNEPVPAECN